MENLFDFSAISALFQSGFRMRFDAMNAITGPYATEVLERRINGLGVAESTLQTVGRDKLVLQLPGEQNPSRAARVLGTTALLEFRAQRPGTEQEMQGLLQLKRQAEAVVAARRPQAIDGTAVTTPREKPTIKADELAKALSGLGLQVPAGSSETDQL